MGRIVADVEVCPVVHGRGVAQPGPCTVWKALIDTGTEGAIFHPRVVPRGSFPRGPDREVYGVGDAKPKKLPTVEAFLRVPGCPINPEWGEIDARITEREDVDIVLGRHYLQGTSISLHPRSHSMSGCARKRR